MRTLLVLGIAGAVVFAWMAQKLYTTPGIGAGAPQYGFEPLRPRPLVTDPSDPGYITTWADVVEGRG